MIRKVIAFSMSLMCISSCAMANFEYEYYEFYKESVKRSCVVFPMPAYFAKIENNVAGYCIPTFGILINEERWASMGPYQKKELIFHELGHCVLGLEHKEPGLMAPVMHSEEEVKKNWDAWVNEFFKDCIKWPAPKKETEKNK